MWSLPRQWLKPPGTLLISLFLLTLASVSALVWLGWRFQEQERLVEAQRAQVRLEESADRLVTSLRSALAEAADRLTDASEPGPDGALLLVFRGLEVTASPAGRLLYQPADALPAPDTAVFAEAEMFEFVRNQPEEAARLYERLAAGARDAPTRAGALLRLARVLRSAGRPAESSAAWQKLAGMPASLAVSGVPVQLAALLETGDTSAVVRGLSEARWPLTRAQFEYFWERAAGSARAPDAESFALSDAAARAWQQLVANPDAAPRGQEVIWAASRPWLVIWRAPTEDRRAVLLAHPAEWLKRAASAAPAGIEYALVDAQGRKLAGQRSGAGRAAIRPAGETQLPWTVYAALTGPAGGDVLGGRQRFVLSGIAVMAGFLVLGTYFIARAIRREAEVARMQSNFVSSVSHEFRSPLTSMRQLSEILALGRVPSEERRQLYYETLVRETTRLQRVVEALLNFGQLESGTRKFRFQLIDAGEAIRQSVAEFRHDGAARTIELHHPDEPCPVEADAEAIGVALRNLLDNAVKYSPDPAPVHVAWSRHNGHVSIAVRDAGPGISRHEERTIFHKFVRGSAAAAGNVKGSGIGLAMVRDIVAAHRGQVAVESRPGKGSTFTITIPAAGEKA